MKNFTLIKSLFLLLSFAFLSETYAADYSFPAASAAIAIGDNTGCAATTYTFTQRVPNTANMKINTGAVVVYTFPAGTNLSTVTRVGCTFKGVQIGATGWSVDNTAKTITFQAPTSVGVKKTFTVVFVNVTNGNNVSANASVSMVNDSGGVNTYASFAITTTACPTTPANNNCTGVDASFTLSVPAAGSSTCTTLSGTTFGANLSPQTTCGGAAGADDDVWYRFTANNANHQITVDGVAGFNAAIEVFSGTCAGTLTLIGSCVNATGAGGVETANLSGLTNGTTYFVRVYNSTTGAGVSAANSFTICATSTAPAAGCPGIGAGNLVAGSLPYTSGAQTTCGAGDDITSSNVTNICGSSLYYGGEDKVISFVPGVTGNISINLTSAGSWLGMTLYQGCPISGGTCVANSQSSLGNQSIGCAPVIGGQTYYLVVDSWPTPTCNAFNVTISAPTAGIPPGTTCGNPVAMTLPYQANNESTLCFGDDYTNATAGVGTTSYMSGEDKVYEFDATGPDCISISITNANTTYVGVHVFSGCPGAGGTLIGRIEGASGGALSGSITLPSAGTYYLIVDTYAAPSSVNYNIAISSLGSGPANDAICSAQALTLGSASGGDNNCTGSVGEPAAPGCWSTGAMNTVWYSVVIPASGKLKVRTTGGSLANTQIALYSGACGSPTFVAGSCNDNVASCSGFTSNDSEINLTGLTVGATYFVRVDGSAGATGTFSILAVDGNNPITPIPGQDCGDPNPVCNSIMAVSNPGYSGYGNICDLPTSYCLASGERNVVWYRVPIAAGGDGTLRFDIVPNDFNYTNESETDYDFAIWEITDAGVSVVTCAQIAAGTAPAIACNFSYLGVTGVGTAAGNPPATLPTTVCPSCPPAYNPSIYSGAYESEIDAEAGDVYLIAVSNFISSSSGFRIEFGGTADIDFAASLAAAGAVTWSGGDASLPTVWTELENWGGCTTPSCTRDAYVTGFSNQPILTTTSGNSGGAIHTVKNLTIQAGASLTIQSGATLEICGDFYNFGTLNAHPNSTVKFVGAGVNQIISGNFTGSNKFGNLMVTKSSAAFNVTAMNDIEVGGTFTTSNATSVFNSNGRYITVGGDFMNSTGNTTFTNTGTAGTLEFNGTGAQTYNQGSSQLDLNKVVVNNTGGIGTGVSLATNMFIKATTGTLTLNNGTITTGGTLNTAASATISGGFKVHVSNTTPASVSAGNVNSFVDGTLRRYLGASGSYDWPVGSAAKGYQRANTNFTSTTGMSYVDVRFDAWPVSCGTNSTVCSEDMTGPTFDNGMWTFLPSGGTCSYTGTLYPTNVGNYLGDVFTIMKRPHTSAIDNTGWIFDGSCAAGDSSNISRTGMTNFSFMGVEQNLIDLPIELLSFTGVKEGLKNKLEWVTSSERENDFFTLEKSQNGTDFTFLAEVDGAGNSNSILNYFSYDFNPYQGVTYYRLKQTDFDGEFTFSEIIALSNEMHGITISEVYPNPTTGNTAFDIFTPTKGQIEFKLFDNAGRLVLSKTEKVNNGTSTINVELVDLAKGVYSLEVKFDDMETIKVQKVIKN
jgi:hypothetical protein